MRSDRADAGNDALKFLKHGVTRWPADTLIYLDPPYYVKGRALYHDFYEHQDHEKVSKFMMGATHRQRWIVSYDNVQTIRCSALEKHNHLLFIRDRSRGNGALQKRRHHAHADHRHAALLQKIPARKFYGTFAFATLVSHRALVHSNINFSKSAPLKFRRAQHQTCHHT